MDDGSITSPYSATQVGDGGLNGHTIFHERNYQQKMAATRRRNTLLFLTRMSQIATVPPSIIWLSPDASDG